MQDNAGAAALITKHHTIISRFFSTPEGTMLLFIPNLMV